MAATRNETPKVSSRLDRWRFTVEVLTLLVLGIYTWFTYRLYASAQRNAEDELRPWVLPASSIALPPIPPGRDINTELALQNSGKLPAFHVQQNSATWIGKDLPKNPQYPPDTDTNVPSTAPLGPGGVFVARIIVNAYSAERLAAR